MSRTTPQLALDPIACVGHGLCAELFPEGIVLDDWGFPILLDEAQDPAQRVHAKRAAKACPALALKLRARARRSSPEPPRRATGSSQPSAGSWSS